MEINYHDDALTSEQIAEKKEKLLDMLHKLTDDATERYKKNGIVDCYYNIVASDWNNYGKNRTYINVYENREGSKHSKKIICGYFDNITGDYVPKDCRQTYVFDILKDKI